MSSVIAIVKSIVGQVMAMSPEGFQRLLVEGDRLFKGDQLQTGLEGMVTLELTDGRTLDLGHGTQWSEVDAVAAVEPQAAEAVPQSPADDVAQLQKAIEAGVDPTRKLEATAAGPSAGGAGGGSAGGGHSFVMLDATAARTDATIGFLTVAAPVAGEPQPEKESTPLNEAPLPPGPLPESTPPVEILPVPDGPNSAPQGQDASITTDEDTPVQGQLGANDPDGDALAYSLGDGPRNGSLLINPNGSYTYTPNKGFNGGDSFTAIVDDGKGGTATITVTIGVSPVNDAPAAVDDGPAAITEDTPATGNVLANDSDVDGDSLAVNQFSIGGSTYQAGQTAVINGVGSLAINGDGSYTFTPAPNYTGPVPTATYTVSDGSLTDTGELSLADVSPVNDAPETAATTASGVEDNPISVSLGGSDSDGSIDHFVIQSLPANGTLLLNGVALAIGAAVPATANGATLTFVPDAHWNGSTSFDYAAVDNDGLEDSSPATATITVSAVNDAPESNPVFASGAEDAAGISVALSGSDLDSTVDHFVIKALPANGALLLNGVALAIGATVPASANGATLTFVPAPNWNGSTDFLYAAVDNDGLEDNSPATATITVSAVNDAPETTTSTAAGAEDAAGIPVVLSGSDLDGSVDHFVIQSLPANGTLLLNGVALAIGAAVPATANGATVIFVPNANWNGSTDFQYAAVDNDGLEDSSPATATITVASVNDAPETQATSASGTEEAAGIPVALSGSDLDGSVDHFVIKTLPANGTLLLNGIALAIGAEVPATANGATLTFVPNANWNGSTNFQYAAVDNLGLEDSSPATATISVAAVNDAPETAAVSASGAENASGIPVALSGSDLDGSVDHFVIQSLPANGTLLLNGVALAIGAEVPATANGATLTFVPNAHWNGSTTFQYAAVDNDGLEDSSPATATINIAAVNDAPETAAASAFGAEDAAGIPVALSGSDLDGNVDHFVIQSLPANGTLLLNGVALVIGAAVPATANGATVTFVPAANWNGSTSFDYAAVDNLGLEDSSPATATISVATVNDAPETATTSASGAEDAAGIPVALGGSDLDGSIDHFVIQSLPANGTLLLNGVALAIGAAVPATANGATVTFVPDAHWNGSTDFQYAAVDNDGLKDATPATATVTVASVNNAPETQSTSASGAEDAAGIPVALSGSDLDGNVDHFVIKTLPANGTLLLNGVALAIGAAVPASANGATLTFVPAANWNGSTSFDYAAVDNLGLEDSSPATATITVSAVNDAPETAATAASGAEDAAGIPVALSGSDLDGTIDHFVIQSLPANGTLLLNGVALAVGAAVPASANGATLTFVPNVNWNGSTSFDYAAVDNQGLEDNSPATATISVTAVNDAPETAASTAAGAEDAAGIPVALSGSDLDGTVDHFVIQSLPANGTLLLNGIALAIGAVVPASANGATLTFVPAANWNGSTGFDYAAVDNQGLEDATPATATITVSAVNDAPETAATAASGAEDAAGIPVALSGSDLDGSIDHFVIQSLPANGTLLLNGVALAIGAAVPASANGATLTFVPSANWNGSTSFDYAAVDNQGLEDATPATATISITAVNDAPETATTSASGAEDAAGIPVALSGSDLDGNVDHFVIQSLPANGTLLLNGVALAIGAAVPATANGATLTFVPATNWNGSTSFDYAAVDNLGLEDSSPATATINIAAVNDAPDTAPISASGTEDAAGIPVALSGSDLDGSVDHFVIQSLPANGTLLLNGVALTAGAAVPATANGATVTFVPDANWNGSTSFLYASVDNQGLEDATPATATVTVSPVNDAPETAAASGSGNEDNPISVSLSGSDVDGNVDHFVIKSVPAGGTLFFNGAALAIGSVVPASSNAASITFVPNANWNGATSFQYASVDNLGLEDSSPATATLTVASVNNAPETAAVSASGNEDTSISVNLSGSDIDGNVAHFVIKSLPAGGTLLLNGVALAIGSVVPASANGASITFVPSANWNGSTSFQYAAVDNLGLEDASPATATLSVAAVNDGPVFGVTTATAIASEEGLTAGLADSTGSPSDTTNALIATGTFAISDIDGPSLSVTLTAPATALTSNGLPLTWSGNGTSTLSASAGGLPIMTISITSAGAYTVTLLGQVDHPQANLEDVLSFSVGVTASDGASSASGTLQVSVEDDAPVLAAPMQSIMLDSSGATAIGDLNLSTGADANGTSVQFSTTTGVSVDASGYILSTALDKSGAVINSSSYPTYQGSKLHYETGTNSLTAVSADGTQVFKITADPVSGQYQVTNYVNLDSPSSTFTSFDLSGGNSGAYDLGVGSQFSLQATATTINSSNQVITDTVNTSDNSFGVGSGQSIDTGDVLKFTFIDKSTNLATDMTSVSLITDKLGSSEKLTWTAFDSAGIAVGSGTVNGVPGGTASFTIDSSKLNSGEHEFSSISFGAGASTSYKLIISAITGQTEAYDQRITLGVKATDGDHDSTASQSLQITFDSDNTIQAGSSGSALGGGGGANNLIGGAGDDILAAGGGNDTMTGGAGADTLVWKSGDAGTAGSPNLDVVKDFKPQTEQDRLDLSDLLHGETTSNIDNYLQLIVDSGTGNATLLVSKEGHLNDGGSAASHADLSVTLEGAASQLSGSSINSLIAGADPTIKVDNN